MSKENDKPHVMMQGVSFYPVPEFTDGEVAFGATYGASNFFPRGKLRDIYVPRKFSDMAETLFYEGGKLPKFHPKVDLRKAKKALAAWLRSFEPAHEAKLKTVGYALWLWTSDTLDHVYADE
jgi:hypothetical protein